MSARNLLGILNNAIVVSCLLSAVVAKYQKDKYQVLVEYENSLKFPESVPTIIFSKLVGNKLKQPDISQLYSNSCSCVSLEFWMLEFGRKNVSHLCRHMITLSLLKLYWWFYEE